MGSTKLAVVFCWKDIWAEHRGRFYAYALRPLLDVRLKRGGGCVLWKIANVENGFLSRRFLFGDEFPQLVVALVEGKPACRGQLLLGTRGRWKKNCTNSHKKRKWRGRELSNSAVIVCGRQACSGSKILRFCSPCDGDVHAVRSGVPCMPLIFTTSGSHGKAKWDLCVFFSPLPCPFHWNLVSAGVCKASRALESHVSSPLTSSWAYSSALAQVSSKKAKWEVPGMKARGRRV